MDKPYLIQRLTKPPVVENNPMMAALCKAFSFGGGYQNGGFTNEGTALIEKVCWFDYMGSAEFEFGDVPKSFSQILQNEAKGLMTQGELTVNISPEKYLWPKDKPMSKKPYPVTVWYYCRKEEEEQVKEAIKNLALGYKKGNVESNLKDPSLFINAATDQILKKESSRQVVGWIDILNHFCFFIDQKMRDDLVALNKQIINTPDTESEAANG